MSWMVERVADALWQHDSARIGARPTGEKKWKEIARLAIGAMREATRPMIHAGAARARCGPEDFLDGWESAIDEALK
jgi:hypothetical protein